MQNHWYQNSKEGLQTCEKVFQSTKEMSQEILLTWTWIHW